MTTNAPANTQSAGRPVVNLAAPGVAKAIASRVLEDIDRYCVETYDGGHRSHLGASLIGRECKRYLWYVFRWCLHEKHTGRQQRLFNRGHREEARFIEWLEGVGFKVWFEDRETNPLYYCAEDNRYYLESTINKEENRILQNLAVKVSREDSDYNAHIAAAKAQGVEFPQYRISDCLGHFGGSLDGVAQFPEWYGIDEAVLLEFKTNGTGPKFDKMVSNGMALTKPEHFAQTSVYGKKRVFRYCLYMNINKNDDTLHVELVKLDERLGEQMIMKAEQIIFAKKAPFRLSDNPTFQKCTWCSMKDVCHKGATVERNCRSCTYAVPVENAEWFCEVHEGVIPKDFILKACDSYKSITQNV